jgi:enterochelin esterase-like enzyme
MIVGVHRPDDETLRLHEYSPPFDPERFAAHERFFVDDVREWTGSKFGIRLPAARTAVMGVSAGGELALALGLRHPDIFGTIFCASPGAGYRPPARFHVRISLPGPPSRSSATTQSDGPTHSMRRAQMSSWPSGPDRTATRSGGMSYR